ncbi:MAG: phytanoyl-CoA dioxygenase family protein [Bacteroidetes bacterium]|nr:phytanoyl-CoA dioxygenase family protein [Bacteroidota bacterium]
MQPTVFSADELQQALDYYNKNGFVAIDSTLDEHYLSELRKIMLELIEVEKEAINLETYRDYGFLLCALHYADKYPQILEVLNNQEMLKFVETILEKWFIVYLYSNNCIPPNGGNTKAYKPHIDTPRYINNYHQSVVAMITMDDYTEENGATWVLPASQEVREKPTDEYFYNNAFRLVVPKGTICFFDPRVWHAAGTNFSSDWRTCLLIVFCRPWMKQRVDIPRFMSHIDKNTLSKHLQQLLGFHSAPPANFKEFYGDEHERTFVQPFV